MFYFKTIIRHLWLKLQILKSDGNRGKSVHYYHRRNGDRYGTFSCVKLALSEKIPIEDQKENILEAFARQAHEQKKKDKNQNVRKIARILSLFFKFPKTKGKGNLKEESAEAEIYKSIRDIAEAEEEALNDPKQ